MLPTSGYFDRMRRGEPPGQSETVALAESDEDLEADLPPDMVPFVRRPVRKPVVAPVEVESIAPLMPDPSRPYWWFAVTVRLNRKRRTEGPERHVWEKPGTRLPLEADYWCHEGDAEWTKVDRTLRPKPAPVKRPKAKRRPKVGH